MSTLPETQHSPSQDAKVHDIYGDDYSDMVRDIGIDKFQERFSELSMTMNRFLEEAGYSEYVECNHRILLAVLLDYWADIYRLKDFHLIEKARTDKIFPYLISWILQRKPLQLTKNSREERDIYVNERFAAYMFLNECLMSHNRVVEECYQDKLDEFVDFVVYYFKYRRCNPQVVELMIRSFEMGCLTKQI